MSDDMFRTMVKAFGADKIIFGTDCPWAEQKDYVDRMNAMGLSDNELELIFHKNVEKILGL
jgi:predicted TIM-barrel fold metal-dependent hydrolase